MKLAPPRGEDGGAKEAELSEKRVFYRSEQLELSVAQPE
jgi:hypothetical protein